MPINKRHNEKSQKNLRKDLRNNATAAEAILWRKLKAKQVGGLKFRRQHGIGPYILDFYCSELKLNIELDGEPHQSEEQNIHDLIRTKFLNENKIHVLRYENEVVYHHIDAIVDDIQRVKEKKYNEIMGKFWPAISTKVLIDTKSGSLQTAGTMQVDDTLQTAHRTENEDD